MLNLQLSEEDENNIIRTIREQMKGTWSNQLQQLEQYISDHDLLKRQVKKMQKTLEWYADGENYLVPFDGPFRSGNPNIEQDNGNRARKTIQSLKGEESNA